MIRNCETDRPYTLLPGRLNGDRLECEPNVSDELGS
jgi:hypothetical protein